MNKIPKIPTLCICGCNEVVWNGRKFVKGHNARIDGFHIGHKAIGQPFQKGHKTWLGRTHSKDTRDKLSKIHNGKTLSETTRRKIGDFWRGKKHSLETIAKRTKAITGKTAHFWTKESRDKASKAHLGEKSSCWKGGISFIPYCPKFNNQLKDRIRERDDRTCQLCGIKENGKRSRVHHIHYDKPNCDPDLIALCHSCHAKTNHNRDYWENYFIELLVKRGLIIQKIFPAWWE